MKKLLSLVSLLFCIVFASAATVNIETTDNVVYLENTTAQIGTSAKINVMLKAVNTIGSVKVIFDMPEGVTIDETPVSPGAFVTWNENEYILVLGKGAPYYSTGVMATLNVNIAPTAKLGENEMKITYYSITEPSLATYEVEDDEVVSTLTIQKTAVIEPQDPNYAFEIVPFVTEAGKTYTSAADNSIEVPVILKNADYVSEAKFNLTLPTGFTIASYKSGMKTTTKKPEVASSRSYNVSEGGSNDLVVNQSTSGNVVTYTLTSTGDGDFVLSEGSGELCKVYLTTASTVEPGVYTIKIDNISITSTPDGEEMTTHEGGEYLASVIVGQPAAQEAILYGHYDEATAEAFSTAMKNVAIADVTAATVEEGAKFTDVLVNEKGGNSYYTRTSANYGTTVLPLDLMTTDNVDKLYRIESMDANSIVITEAENVPANTPCIFKGTINVEGATPTLGVPSEQDLGQTTFKGTYSATSIAEGEGYYISSNGKFYGDGATVRPFRGYFVGAIAGVKSFSVLIDTPDGLKDITDQFSKEDIYNLQGIRVNNVQKGINIKGGKKVLVK